jgi:hypothetical protein
MRAILVSLASLLAGDLHHATREGSGDEPRGASGCRSCPRPPRGALSRLGQPVDAGTVSGQRSDTPPYPVSEAHRAAHARLSRPSVISDEAIAVGRSALWLCVLDLAPGEAQNEENLTIIVALAVRSSLAGVLIVPGHGRRQQRQRDDQREGRRLTILTRCHPQHLTIARSACASGSRSGPLPVRHVCRVSSAGSGGGCARPACGTRNGERAEFVGARSVGAGQRPVLSAPGATGRFSPWGRRTAARRAGSPAIHVGTPHRRAGRPSRSRCCGASRPAHPACQL